jgi:hypothetical protein
MYGNTYTIRVYDQQSLFGVRLVTIGLVANVQGTRNFDSKKMTAGDFLRPFQGKLKPDQELRVFANKNHRTLTLPVREVRCAVIVRLTVSIVKKAESIG